MRALVVYESMYGNTHVVASNIADGLRATHEVTLVPVSEATPELLAGADLLVAGAPTHMHGMPSASTRRMAAQAAAKQGSELTLDPGARGLGIRDWMLKRHGCRLVAAPASFLVSQQNTLLDGEAARARRWGMTLGAVSKTRTPAHA
jgi:hypothetical protein